MDVVLADGREEDVLRSLAAMEPDALDELSQSLFARITETVVSHEPEDWAMYYDRLCVVVCRVVAQSRQSDMAKTVLTRRLIALNWRNGGRDLSRRRDLERWLWAASRHPLA
jgi:hypothetical protein